MSKTIVLSDVVVINRSEWQTRVQEADLSVRKQNEPAADLTSLAICLVSSSFRQSLRASSGDFVDRSFQAARKDPQIISLLHTLSLCATKAINTVHRSKTASATRPTMAAQSSGLHARPPRAEILWPRKPAVRKSQTARPRYFESACRGSGYCPNASQASRSARSRTPRE